VSVHLCLQHVCRDAAHCAASSATADTCFLPNCMTRHRILSHYLLLQLQHRCLSILHLSLPPLTLCKALRFLHHLFLAYTVVCYNERVRFHFFCCNEHISSVTFHVISVTVYSSLTPCGPLFWCWQAILHLWTEQCSSNVPCASSGWSCSLLHYSQ